MKRNREYRFLLSHRPWAKAALATSSAILLKIFPVACSSIVFCSVFHHYSLQRPAASSALLTLSPSHSLSSNPTLILTRSSTTPNSAAHSNSR